MRSKDVSDAIIIQSSALVFSELINEAVTYNSLSLNDAVLTGEIKYNTTNKQKLFYYILLHSTRIHNPMLIEFFFEAEIIHYPSSFFFFFIIPIDSIFDKIL